MQEQISPKKRITFVLGSLIGGGAERVASVLINEWFDRGYDITLITRLGPEKDFFKVPDEIERIVLGGEGESSNKIVALLKNIPFVWKLRKAIKKAGKQNIVSFLTKPNIHTIIATIGLKKKVIISERNDTTRQNYPKPWPQLRKIFYKYSDVVTANSSIALKGMKGYVPDEKLKFVPNPVYIPSKKATPHQSNIILNVGRLISHKNQDLIIKAFAKIENDIKNDWQCNFLGDGEERENLEKIRDQLKLTNVVSFKGLVSNTTDYYQSSAIFVLASDFEGTPNVLLEAMAHGLPSIVSDSLPGALEYLKNGENGLVFKAGDTEDLFEKLQLLMNNPDLRKKLGANAVKRVEPLSVDYVTQIWENLIGNL